MGFVQTANTFKDVDGGERETMHDSLSAIVMLWRAPAAGLNAAPF